MNKILGGLIIVMALVIGIVPVFTDCLANGRSLTTNAGISVPMKCHWSAVAEIGVAVPLALVGILTFFSKRKETVRSLAAFGVTLGALAIAFPTVLIGTCASDMMPCNMMMKPIILFSGVVAIGLSLVVAFRTRKGGELAA
jgi:hypothetical protein